MVVVVTGLVVVVGALVVVVVVVGGLVVVVVGALVVVVVVEGLAELVVLLVVVVVVVVVVGLVLSCGVVEAVVVVGRVTGLAEVSCFSLPASASVGSGGSSFASLKTRSAFIGATCLSLNPTKEPSASEKPSRVCCFTVRRGMLPGPNGFIKAPADTPIVSLTKEANTKISAAITIDFFITIFLKN